MYSKKHQPVYQKLVETVRAGFLALDETVQHEIITFIFSQQHNNGGFVDRAGQPDLYYSLFGLWLSIATRQDELQSNLKEFVVNTNRSALTSPVEDLALLLIRAELNANFKKQSVFSIIQNVKRKGSMIDLSYQFFLISLVIDAVGKNKKIFYFFARIWLAFYKPKGSIPCSIRAALVYARKIVQLNTQKTQKELGKYGLENGGFRAFENSKTSDTLSTGVALFVLKECSADIRVITPGCLNFIQENYFDGAFLSGDGDLTKDLEYTFYGLLALGSMV